MTVLIGIVDKKRKGTIMGSDKCVTTNLRKYSFGENDTKIYQPEENKNFLIGFAGDIRIKQLFSSFIIMPREEQIAAENLVIDEKFLVRSLFPQLQKVLKENEYIDVTGTVGGMCGSRILIAYKDNLWDVCGNFQLLNVGSTCYLTAGSGEFTAGGAIEAFNTVEKSLGDDLPALYKVVNSLKIATTTSIGVEGPYDIYATGSDKLDDETVNGLFNGDIPLLPIEVYPDGYKQNYVKKVLAKDIGIETMGKSKDIMFLATKDRSEIYFIDYNDVLYGITDKGTLITDIAILDDLANAKYDVVELNQKGYSLIESFKDINLVKPEENPEDEVNEATKLLSSLGFDVDTIMKVIKDSAKEEVKKEIDATKSKKKASKPKKSTKKEEELVKIVKTEENKKEKPKAEEKPKKSNKKETTKKSTKKETKKEKDNKLKLTDKSIRKLFI